MQVQISYTPIVIAATSTNRLPQAHGIGKFICTATGTLTISDDVGTILNAFTITAGQIYELGIDARGNEGFTVTTATGGAGTLLYWG